MGDGLGVLGSLLFGFAILIILFLLFREVICWYWKINEGVVLLQQIRDLLREQRRGFVGTTSPLRTPIEVITTTCMKCDKVFEGDLSGQFCEECGTRLGPDALATPA